MHKSDPPIRPRPHLRCHSSTEILHVRSTDHRVFKFSLIYRMTSINALEHSVCVYRYIKFTQRRQWFWELCDCVVWGRNV